MNKTRLEAFSDGVIAIIITIMVLELRPPHEVSLKGLQTLIPTFVSYAGSFLYVAIYWGNHHHLFHTVKNINSKIIWANFSLLFCLSLIPFATAFISEHYAQTIPVVLYSIVLLASACTYSILQAIIAKHHHYSAEMKRAMRFQTQKGILSAVFYCIAIIVACTQPLISEMIIFIVALMWVIPDKNIEKALQKNDN